MDIFEMLEDALPVGSKKRKEVFHRSLRAGYEGDLKKSTNALEKVIGKPLDKIKKSDITDHERKVDKKYNELITRNNNKEKLTDNIKSYNDKHAEYFKKHNTEKNKETFKNVKKLVSSKRFTDIPKNVNDAFKEQLELLNFD